MTESLWDEVLARLRVKWVVLRTGIEERLVYRADFVFSTLVRFLPIVTQIFLWNSVFANDGSVKMRGYTYADMVAYFLLVMLARAFSSMPGLAAGIAQSIADGSIRKYLIQPVDMLDHLFWHRVAHKLVYYIIAGGPFAIVFWMCRDYLPGWPAWQITCYWILSLIMAFLAGFLIESLIGLIAFWMLEISSLIYIYMILSFFLSGHMIPLEWISQWLPWVDWLPFRYLAYFPTAIILGKIPQDRVVHELCVQAAWVLVLLIINRIAWNRGVRRYSAFGG
ncbi:MAG: ABC transporter permease [Planctomyces sp.]